MGFLDIQITGGANLFDDPRRIRDDECTYAKNLVPYVKGMLSKRPALQTERQLNQAFSGDLEIYLEQPLPKIPYYFVSRELDGSVFTYAHTDGVFNGAFASNFGQYRPVVRVYGNNIYMLLGPGASHTGAVRNNDPLVPETLFAFNGTGNSDLKPAGMTIYRERAVYFNFGPGYEDYVIFSDPFDPLTIGDNALTTRAFRVLGEDSGRLVAAVEIMQSAVGSPSESALIFMKEQASSIMTGEPNWTTDPDDELIDNVTLSRVNYACGCASPDTVVKTPYGIMWAGPDDVWAMNIGALPVRVGSKIRPILQATTAAMRHRWIAAYHNGFYRLAVFSPGQGPTLAGTTLPLLGEQWWLDLRDGPSQGHADARWWGPQIFNVADQTGTSVFVRRIDSDALYDAQWNATEGAVMLSQYDVPGERDGIVAPYLDSIEVLTQNAPQDYDATGCEITCELRTKEYDMGAPLQQKGFVRLVADYWTNASARLQLQTIAGGGQTLDTSDAACSPDGLLLGRDSSEGATLTRTFQEAVLYPSTRVVGKTLQFKIYDTAGYCVDSTNDTVTLLYDSTYYIISIPHGLYVNMEGLTDAIATATSIALSASGPDLLELYFEETAATTRGILKLISNIGNNFSLLFQSGGGSITSSDLAKCRALMGLLGFNTSANTVASTFVDAATTVYYKNAPLWDFGGFGVEYDLFNRGPA
jgi:hypothetical protein